MVQPRVTRGGHGRGSRAKSWEATWAYLTDLRRARTSCLRMRFCLFPSLSLFADNSMTFPTVCLSVCLSLSLSLSRLSPALSLFLPSSVCLLSRLLKKNKPIKQTHVERHYVEFLFFQKNKKKSKKRQKKHISYGQGIKPLLKH